MKKEESVKINAILADCDAEEVKTFQDGVNDGTSWGFITESCISNGSHGGGYRQLKRYLKYFTFPWKVFVNRKKYNIIIGWQQFYAINFAFYCRLFHVKKRSPLIAGNFTYKAKGGIVGKIYRGYMSYALHGGYVDYLHVPSFIYAKECSKDLSIPIDKFLVTTFGIPDIYDKWKNSTTPFNDYTLSIGRSNRDFDFLIDVWKESCLADKKLVIISDTYKPKGELPKNIIYYNNITGDDSLPWIANCKLMVIPIDDGAICSGDTVLLHGMQFEKAVVVTAPSTLSEMYLQDGVDGRTIKKDKKKFAEEIAELLKNDEERKQLGENARKSYLNKFSRFQLGKQFQEDVRKLLATNNTEHDQE